MGEGGLMGHAMLCYGIQSSRVGEYVRVVLALKERERGENLDG